MEKKPGIPFTKKAKVLVAMSGGVDSSAAAYLLAKKGYNLTGVYMKLPVFSSSSNKLQTDPDEINQGLEDVQKVCQKLDIPLLVIDCRQEFQKEVIDAFCREYMAGRTPNPCIVCNQKIKFGLLMEKARSLGFDFLATGHYVSLDQDRQSKRFFLKRAKDIHKDQSYFLYTLKQLQLQRTLFPLENYTKAEVRAMVKKLALPIHDKSESQEICFIPKGDYSEFLKNRTLNQAKEKGPILNLQGKVLGYHKGIYSYTIGQRRGLGLYNPSPLYVLAIDPKQNAIIVGEESETYQDELIATQLNWMLIPSLRAPLSAYTQIRYRHQPKLATIFPLGNDQKTALVRFHEPVKSIALGQSVVFYQKNRILGGGVIDKAGRQS